MKRADKSGNIIRQLVTNSTNSFPDAGNQEVLFNKTGFIEAAPANDWANSIGSYYLSPNGTHIIFAVNQTYRHPPPSTPFQRACPDRS